MKVKVKVESWKRLQAIEKTPRALIVKWRSKGMVQRMTWPMTMMN